LVGEVLGESFLGYILEREYLSVGAGMLFIVLVKFWMLPPGVPPHLTLEKYMSSLFVPSASMLGFE